jgi:glucokinase
MSSSSVFPVEEAPQTASAATVGVILASRIYAGLIVDGELEGPLVVYPDTPLPDDGDDDTSLVELPTESLVAAICDVVRGIARGYAGTIGCVGVALPGLLRHGVVDEAPNLPQLKGARVGAMLSDCLREHGITVPLSVLNDADAVAAGLAARHGRLDHVVRVWTLGTGIGYGHYPFSEGIWEGGHTTVTLDEHENFCGCGGKGHLEGIMGHRAMRLRFLDMEPEEVFEAANRHPNPDPRCVEFKKLWHKALAAATSSAIHIGGPGKFYITGYNVRFLDMGMLRGYLNDTVKMSSLQSYTVEIVEGDKAVRVLGAGVSALQIASLR